MPVYRADDGELRLVIVRRGDQGPHGGQLAFPGGKCEPGDGDALATALRETREEIGIDRVVFSLPAEKDDKIMPILDRWAELKRQLEG